MWSVVRGIDNKLDKIFANTYGMIYNKKRYKKMLRRWFYDVSIYDTKWWNGNNIMLIIEARSGEIIQKWCEYFGYIC